MDSYIHIRFFILGASGGLKISHSQLPLLSIERTTSGGNSAIQFKTGNNDVCMLGTEGGATNRGKLYYQYLTGTDTDQHFINFGYSNLSDLAAALGALQIKRNGGTYSSISDVPAFTKENICFCVANNVGEYLGYSNVIRIWCGYYGLEINVGSLESKGRKFFIESDNTVTTYNWQRLDGFGATTAADLASILGVDDRNGKCVHIETTTTSFTINKGERQCILFMAINGPTATPSIFICKRFEAVSLYEGTVPRSSLSFDSTTGNITVSKSNWQHMWYRMWDMEYM